VLEPLLEAADGPIAALGEVAELVTVKLHTLAYPPRPAPEVSGRTEALLGRLSVLADVRAWARLLRFARAQVEPRLFTGQWGPPADRYYLQCVPGGGVRTLDVRLQGVSAWLPPAGLPSSARCGGAVEVACEGLTLEVDAALPVGRAAVAGAVGDSSAAQAMKDLSEPHVGVGVGQPGALVPVRARASVAGLTLTAQHHPGGPLTLLHPLSLAVGVSIDSLAASTAEPVSGGSTYVPLGEDSIMCVTGRVGTLKVHLDLRAWLAAADCLAAHLTCLREAHDMESASCAAPPAPPLKGAALVVVGGSCGVEVEVPTPEGGEGARKGAHTLHFDSRGGQVTLLKEAGSGSLHLSASTGRVQVRWGEDRLVLLGQEGQSTPEGGHSCSCGPQECLRLELDGNNCSGSEQAVLIAFKTAVEGELTQGIAQVRRRLAAHAYTSPCQHSR
jgi:hypothetical protein